ncbi:MAG: hypothetical protein LBG17_04710 [Bacteroidales bacterium]|jgi:hypothetical protein|nr:hypothetical protein [Bacteroidales bacterium]
MAVLRWGKPKIEIARLTSGELGNWVALDVPKLDSTQLTVEEGEETTAQEEGGAIVDSRRNANAYSLAFSLFAKKDEDKPLSDSDGVIADNYAIRLTPEDPATGGYQMLKCSVSVTESWTSADGGLWTYTFKGLKPATGSILQDYTPSQSSGSGEGE